MPRTTTSPVSTLLVALLLQLCAALPSAHAQDIIESFIAQSTPEAPRQSEGDITVLKDSTLLAAWSDFYGGSEDNAAARISAAKSTDGGRTWGPRYTLQENNGQANVMSVSFVRSSTSGDLLLFYLRKNSLTDLKVFMRRSTDDGATFGEPVLITPEEGYHVMNNARVIQLTSGRLLAPISTTSKVWTRNDNFRTVIYFSDDDGRTWRSATLLSAPKRGAMEPGLIELKDGSVMQIIRTQTGKIWHSYSKDKGETWSEAAPWSIESPESPSTLVRLPDTGDWLLVWNPNVEWKDPEKTVLGANHGGRRTPLVGAISRDEGKTWSTPREIETDPAITYAYTSITPHGDRVLLSYYYFPVGSKDLSLRYKSIPISWFANGGRKEGASSLKVEPKPTRLAIMREGRHVGDYVFSDEKILRPHFRNLHALPGVQVTRQHPPVEGVDAMDHDTMHPGVWLGFGSINGEDFWRNKARIEHVRFEGPVEAKDGVVSFVDESHFLSAAGAPLGTLTSRIRITARDVGMLLEWDATIHASETDLTFGTQEEMGFGARVATALAEKSGNGGLVRTSPGLEGAKTVWGKQATWCSYSGPLHGKHAGIAIFPDPGNPHPTWWHTRDYGVFVANPFGPKAGLPGDGTLTLAKGKSLRLRFAALLYATEQPLNLAKLSPWEPTK